MVEELKALDENRTWDWVPRRNDMNIFGCRWVFKTKLLSDGTLERLKTRFVDKGYNNQTEDVDFCERSAPLLN